MVPKIYETRLVNFLEIGEIANLSLLFLWSNRICEMMIVEILQLPPPPDI